MKRIEKVQMLNIELEKECTELLARVAELEERLLRYGVKLGPTTVGPDYEETVKIVDALDDHKGAGSTYSPKDLVDVINSLKNQDLDTAYERRFNKEVFPTHAPVDELGVPIDTKKFTPYDVLLGDKSKLAGHTMPTHAPVDAEGVKLGVEVKLHESGGGPLQLGELDAMGGGKMHPREALRKGIISQAEYNELMGSNS
jgi:hypothetical protein